MAKKERAKRPKQADLPGMSDRKLADLSDAAHEYAEIRDQRIAMSQEEGALKAKLLGLMKKHEMTKYRYEDVQIDLVVEEETVKVRILKPAEKKKKKKKGDDAE